MASTTSSGADLLLKSPLIPGQASFTSTRLVAKKDSPRTTMLLWLWLSTTSPNQVPKRCAEGNEQSCGDDGRELGITDGRNSYRAKGYTSIETNGRKWTCLDLQRSICITLISHRLFDFYLVLVNSISSCSASFTA